jgi:hypothetical protein
MAAKSMKEILVGFVALSKEALDAKGWGNNVFYHQERKAALIVATQSPRGDDFAINKSVVDHFASSEAEVKVVLVRGTPWDGDIICERAINDVAKSLNGRQPLRGQHGDYFWLNAAGRPAGIRDELDEAPF